GRRRAGWSRGSCWASVSPCGVCRVERARSLPARITRVLSEIRSAARSCAVTRDTPAWVIRRAARQVSANRSSRAMVVAMKFGIIPINVGLDDPAIITRLALHAEAAGLESVWTFEHVVVPVDYASRYPYHSSGKMGASAETVFADPLVTLSHVA